MPLALLPVGDRHTDPAGPVLLRQLEAEEVDVLHELQAVPQLDDGGVVVTAVRPLRLEPQRHGPRAAGDLAQLGHLDRRVGREEHGIAAVVGDVRRHLRGVVRPGSFPGLRGGDRLARGPGRGHTEPCPAQGGGSVGPRTRHLHRRPGRGATARTRPPVWPRVRGRRMQVGGTDLDPGGALPHADLRARARALPRPPGRVRDGQVRSGVGARQQLGGRRGRLLAARYRRLGQRPALGARIDGSARLRRRPGRRPGSGVAEFGHLEEESDHARRRGHGEHQPVHL